MSLCKLINFFFWVFSNLKMEDHIHQWYKFFEQITHLPDLPLIDLSCISNHSARHNNTLWLASFITSNSICTFIFSIQLVNSYSYFIYSFKSWNEIWQFAAFWKIASYGHLALFVFNGAGKNQFFQQTCFCRFHLLCLS